MKIIEIIKNLQEKGIDKVVSATKIVKNEEICYISDTRSAAFYALGESKTIGSPVVLIIDESELESCLTSLTEAWFQKINIIVFTICQNRYNRIDYIERCCKKIFWSDEESFEGKLYQSLNSFGPIIIRCVEEFVQNTKNDYSLLIQKIDSINNRGIHLFIYDGSEVPVNYLTIHNIKTEHKYGVISKYIGWVLGSNEKGILCIPEFLLSYDSNIFNFRNMPNDFHMIILADKSQVLHKLKPWIVANGFCVINEDEQFENVFANKTILYTK